MINTKTQITIPVNASRKQSKDWLLHEWMNMNEWMDRWMNEWKDEYGNVWSRGRKIEGREERRESGRNQ